MELSASLPTENGESLPDGWRMKPLSSVAELKSGLGITSANISDSFGYPCYGGNGLRGFAETFTHEGDFVLVGRQGALCGNVSRVSGKFFASEHAIVFTLPVGVDADWLNAALHRMNLNQYSESSAQPGLSVAKIRRLHLLTPPSDEQQAIGEALRDADRHVYALGALINKKRAVKEAVMQRLLTGRQRLPRFDGEWETRRLNEIALLGGGMSASRADLSIAGHRYLHYGDIHVTERTHAHVHEHYDARPRLDIPLARAKRSSLLNTGDVVFVDASEDEEGASRYVVVDNPTRTPFISGLHTIVAKGLTAHFDPIYMRYAFQAPSVKSQFRFYAAGTKVMGVSKGNMGKIEVPIPERAEQEAIGALLLSMDVEIAALESRRDKAAMIKRAMAQNLLTGRIRLV